MHTLAGAYAWSAVAYNQVHSRGHQWLVPRGMAWNFHLLATSALLLNRLTSEPLRSGEACIQRSGILRLLKATLI